jgi:hypothetical protein
MFGIDISESYLNEAKEKLKGTRANFINEDFFQFNFNQISMAINGKDSLLIVGNPPWVNNSTLSVFGSDNQPVKSNFKGLKGIEAITGSSNFDICEYMLLKLIQTYRNTNTTIAMLCKTIVARNVFKELKRENNNFSDIRILKFDTKKVFNVSVDGCLLVLALSEQKETKDFCDVYDFERPQSVISKFGFINGNFYSEIDNAAIHIDGQCCFEWRQGIKHDCSKIMELTKSADLYVNGNGQLLDIEDTLVFPLVKSSHLKSYLISETKKYVLVTQRKVKEETSYIEELAPRTWKYLQENKQMFNNRKSSIYKNAPDFSMFGIGEYSFADYKVGISGFYKQPIFSLLHGDKPIMLDDTCYFLGFDKFSNAYITMLLLNSDLIQTFLKSVAFLDSKRPYTKKVLERIDFKKCVETISYNDLLQTEHNLNLDQVLTDSMYQNFVDLVNKRTFAQAQLSLSELVC